MSLSLTVLLFSTSNFGRVLIVVFFLLGNSPASEFYMPTFRNTLFHLHRQVGTHLPMKMEQTECSETLAYKIQTLGNYPAESIQYYYCSDSSCCCRWRRCLLLLCLFPFLFLLSLFWSCCCWWWCTAVHVFCPSGVAGTRRTYVLSLTHAVNVTPSYVVTNLQDIYTDWEEFQESPTT